MSKKTENISTDEKQVVEKTHKIKKLSVDKKKYFKKVAEIQSIKNDASVARIKNLIDSKRKK